MTRQKGGVADGAKANSAHHRRAMPYHTLALVQQLLGNGFKSWIVGKLDAIQTNPVISGLRVFRPESNGARTPRLADCLRWRDCRFHFATDFCDSSRDHPQARSRRGREAPPATGNEALRFDLHQTFATPDGLILLDSGFVAKLTGFGTAREIMNYPPWVIVVHAQQYM